jgi:hypothetical protein
MTYQQYLDAVARLKNQYGVDLTGMSYTDVAKTFVNYGYEAQAGQYSTWWAMDNIPGYKVQSAGGGTAATTSGTPSNYTGLPETTPNTSGIGYQAPTIPMGGATEDQINYLSALRRLATQDQAARLQSQQQRSEIATAYEPQIRRAGREMYNQQVKAQASLGARGISGAPGLSVAARRAAMAAPAMQRTSLISDRNRQLAALERTLTSQLSTYEEEIRRNQEQLTRATTLANQLTGTGQ